MNPDLLTEDLKKGRASNESFWLMGQPDVVVRPIRSGDDKGKWEVEVNGFDYFNTKTGDLESGGAGNIAMWLLDPDYDGRAVFPQQIFFPMAGEKEGWSRLSKDLRAQLDEEKLEAFRGTLTLSGEDFEAARRAMEQPQPRVALGLALRGLATAAIDLSDGLAGDLGHVLQRSQLGATVHVDALPISPVLARQPLALQRAFALSGGDDYELLFTAPHDAATRVLAAAATAGVGVRRIGRMEAEPGLRLLDAQGQPVPLALRSFDHFKP
ncbi:MAG: hypothetical protein CFE45_24745 [Burkholderiales bacterium PBB5]|nr:MAG: hypothetical protein CFE45_24745 [Burkholderiales bacterium PBB5]